jgi:hypothetical protein
MVRIAGMWSAWRRGERLPVRAQSIGGAAISALVHCRAVGPVTIEGKEYHKIGRPRRGDPPGFGLIKGLGEARDKGEREVIMEWRSRGGIEAVELRAEEEEEKV